MSTLLLLALATLLHPGQASLAYDIIAEPGGGFNVFIESAYVTKLDGHVIQQVSIFTKNLPAASLFKSVLRRFPVLTAGVNFTNIL